ncbi:hypothetical protein [Tissierella sp. Yu-01]|uniref:hypothetical protein n=1 Tax=Tissierella sp. Yu-01 TaxID=3035694 RepID=UPI00240D4086|nr:hypothetical protein [Tissierella sp. Yu-01]WFA08852.1 hypothetical protein P3962_14170 [Tissierella sp. Yu-01]
MKKHILHMLICCGFPILIIGSLPLIARYSPWISLILGFIAPFICPIMMIGMMFMMFKSKGKKEKSSCCDNKENETSEMLN